MGVGFLSRLKFAHKLALMPLVAGVGFVTLLAMQLRDSARSQATMERIYKSHLPALEAYRDLQETLTTLQRGLQDAAGAADSAMVSGQDGLRDAFVARARAARAIEAVDPNEMDRVATSFTDYYTTARQVTLRLISGEAGEGMQAPLVRMRDQYVGVKDALQALTDKGKREAGSAFEAIIATQRRSTRALWAVTLLAVPILMVLSTSVLFSLVRPLREITGLTRRLADGDLTGRVELRSRDEMGMMAASLNHALGQLRDTMRALGDNSQTLSAAAEELTAVSVEMAGSAQLTSGQAGSASAAAEQVSQNVQTVASGVEEMTASIREIARNAHQAATVATEAVHVAETANRTIAKLSQSSAEISGVVKVITSIAEQTKLLALNAAIEAARAGDSGRGFVVVANEVKELARATGKATEEIAARITATRGDAAEAVSAIGQIGAIVNQIYDSQNAIASAVEQQTATTNEIAGSISLAATASAEIASSVTAVANAAERTATGASSTKQAAAELARMAEELRRLVGRFTA